MKSSFIFWRTATTLSLMVSVVSIIGLIALSESLGGLKSVVTVLSTVPLAFLLMGVRQAHRPTLLIASLLSFIYFSAGVMAMTTSLGDTPLALIYILSIVLWFAGVLMMLKTKPGE